MVVTDGLPDPPQRVRDWLRAVYPGGIPEEDRPALRGILERVPAPYDLEQVVPDVPAGLPGRHDGGAPPGEDVVRVAARLLAAVFDESPVGISVPGAGERSGLVRRTVEWLRRGYPDGLREPDYIPLVALLRRRLTDEEVTQVAAQLRAEGLLAPDRVDIGTAVTRVTEQLPTEDDLKRVQGHLGAAVRSPGTPDDPGAG